MRIRSPPTCGRSFLETSFGSRPSTNHEWRRDARDHQRVQDRGHRNPDVPPNTPIPRNPEGGRGPVQTQELAQISTPYTSASKGADPKKLEDGI